MPERNSWAVALNATTGLISVEDARVAVGGLLIPGSTNVNSRSGFRPSPTEPGQVTPTPTTPDGNVRVSPFQYVMQSGRASVAGAYLVTLDAQKILNILSTPANATNNRNDLVVAQQSDTFYGDANSGMVVKQVVGTPSGTPVDPTVTGSPDYVVLARVVVRANTTSILGSDITDLRPVQRTVAVGGILPCTSATRPTNPHLGQFIYETDTNMVMRWDGAAWKASVPQGGSTAATRHSARYLHNAAQSIPNGGGNTAVQFPGVDRPSNDVVASGTGNSTFTLQRSGMWTISAGFRYSANAGAGERNIAVGPMAGAMLQNSSFPGAGAVNMSISLTDYFTSGTAIAIQAWQNCGVALLTELAAAISRVTITYHGQEE